MQEENQMHDYNYQSVITYQNNPTTLTPASQQRPSSYQRVCILICLLLIVLIVNIIQMHESVQLFQKKANYKKKILFEFQSFNGIQKNSSIRIDCYKKYTYLQLASCSQDLMLQQCSCTQGQCYRNIILQQEFLCSPNETDSILIYTCCDLL